MDMVIMARTTPEPRGDLDDVLVLLAYGRRVQCSGHAVELPRGCRSRCRFHGTQEHAGPILEAPRHSAAVMRLGGSQTSDKIIRSTRVRMITSQCRFP